MNLLRRAAVIDAQPLLQAFEKGFELVEVVGFGWSARRSHSVGWHWDLPALNGCGAEASLSSKEAIYRNFAGAWRFRSGSAGMWPWPSATESPRLFWWGSCGP